MGCGERKEVTGLLQERLQETEKSRHQICADGGDQKEHEENLTSENVTC
jgi:hypothetical protein